MHNGERKRRPLTRKAINRRRSVRRKKGVHLPHIEMTDSAILAAEIRKVIAENELKTSPRTAARKLGIYLHKALIFGTGSNADDEEMRGIDP